MRIMINNKIYYRPVNFQFNINKKLQYILLKSWPWALTFTMFFVLAVLALRCY